MLYCPNCKTEYRDGFTTCADCGAKLTDQIKEADKPENEKLEFLETTLLITLTDHIQCSIIENLLQNENIPYYTKDLGTGGYMKVYTGFSVYGTEIYVATRDYARAIELLEGFETPVQPEDTSPPEEKPTSTKDITIKRVIVALFFLPFLAYFVYELIKAIMELFNN